MLKTKEAFTMVELIFVIVILGTLAMIAMSKLTGTRDDARVTKLAQVIQTIQSELSAGILSSAKIPQNKKDMEVISNTISEVSSDFSIAVINGKTIQFIDTDNGTEICKVLTINDTNISRVTLDFTDGNGTSSICIGVQNLIPNTNSGLIIAGNAVVY
jgi:prepilin-type N-terminal cleavage/methylation domain-containing protein